METKLTTILRTLSGIPLIYGMHLWNISLAFAIGIIINYAIKLFKLYNF
jgi:hypothetical protein